MSHLHVFDLALCRHIHDAVATYLDDPRFADALVHLDDGLKAYLRIDPYPGDDGFHELDQLLGEVELRHLQMLIADAPPRATKKWPPNKWLITSPAISRKALDCLPEFNRELTTLEATDWSIQSNRFDKRLHRRNLLLADGIAIASEWIKLARKYLGAMGLVQFLPQPEGHFPTPTHPTTVESPLGMAPLNRGNLLKNMEKFRKHFKAYPEKIALKPDALKKELQIGNQRARKALRELERLGEYKGFERPPPDRDPS